MLNHSVLVLAAGSIPEIEPAASTTTLWLSIRFCDLFTDFGPISPGCSDSLATPIEVQAMADQSQQGTLGTILTLPLAIRNHRTQRQLHFDRCGKRIFDFSSLND